MCDAYGGLIARIPEGLWFGIANEWKSLCVASECMWFCWIDIDVRIYGVHPVSWWILRSRNGPIIALKLSAHWSNE